MKMRPVFKRAWLRALRSGEYKQETGQLRSRKGFCCLGVFCDVVGPDRWKINRFDFGIETQGLTWPHQFANAVGVPRRTIRNLAGMNDAGNTFSEIADYIERHL